MPAPTKVMIIRHGEKPADPPANPPPHGVNAHGEQNRHSLLPRGWQRAGAIAKLFGGAAPPEPFARPDAVFAPDYHHETPFHRTSDTVTPLAERVGLEVRTPTRKGHEASFVDDHLVDQDGVSVVCWEHHHIPALAQAFARAAGIDEDALPAHARHWPEDDFWSVLVFSRDGGGYTVAVASEDALEGDPAR